MSRTVLLILGSVPYDGSDRTWNALRLAGQLHKDGLSVRLFLMNDAVDLAREGVVPPEGYFDLVKMTKELIAAGVPVKVCGTCQARCGIRKGDPYYEGAQKSSMPELSEWVRTSDQVLTF
jgi:uncharacterized protein involved in oxidation of intracellular sulfur